MEKSGLFLNQKRFSEYSSPTSYFFLRYETICTAFNASFVKASQWKAILISESPKIRLFRHEIAGKDNFLCI